MGNGGGNNTKNLNIFVTSAGTATTQMGVASGGGGGTANQAGSTAPTDKKDDKQAKKKDRKDNQKGLMATLGIQFTLGAMLKQSQIFTGFLGSIFQLIGMFVDVIMAPLAPYLFKLVEIMAGYIPTVAAAAQATVKWLKDAVDYLAEASSALTGVSVSATDLVKKGFQVLSLQGFAAILGTNFATAISGEGFTFSSFFSDKFSADDVEDAIKASMKTGSRVMEALKTTLKNIMTAVMTTFGSKVLSVGAKFLKAAGTIGMIIGITLEMKDIIDSFKEGKVGEAIFKIALAIVGIGVPIALAIILTGGLAIIVPAIAALVIAAVSLMWEFLVPPGVKDTVYQWITDFFKEIADVFKELFTLGGGGFLSKLMNALILMWSMPITLIRTGLSLILSEGIKRTINESIRSFAESIVNGLIGLINSLISMVTAPIKDTFIGDAVRGMGMGKALDFQLDTVSFSSFNVLMGTDTRGEVAAEWASRDMQRFE